MGMRKLEDILEGVVQFCQTVQTVAEISGCLLVEFGSRSPGDELVDVVFDLGNQRVRSAGKTDGPDVVGYAWTARIFSQRATENADHVWREYGELNYWVLWPINRCVIHTVGIGRYIKGRGFRHEETTIEEPNDSGRMGRERRT